MTHRQVGFRTMNAYLTLVASESSGHADSCSMSHSGLPPTDVAPAVSTKSRSSRFRLKKGNPFFKVSEKYCSSFKLCVNSSCTCPPGGIPPILQPQRWFRAAAPATIKVFAFPFVTSDEIAEPKIRHVDRPVHLASGTSCTQTRTQRQTGLRQETPPYDS